MTSFLLYFPCSRYDSLKSRNEIFRRLYIFYIEFSNAILCVVLISKMQETLLIFLLSVLWKIVTKSNINVFYILCFLDLFLISLINCITF